MEVLELAVVLRFLGMKELVVVPVLVRLVWVVLLLSLEAGSHRVLDFGAFLLLVDGRWLHGHRWRLQDCPQVWWWCVRIIFLLSVLIRVHVLIVVVVPALAEDVLEVVVDLLRQVEFVLVDQWLVQRVEQICQATIHLVLGREEIVVANDEILLDLIVLNAVFLAHLVASQQLHVLPVRLLVLLFADAGLLLLHHVTRRGQVVLVPSQAIAAASVVVVGVQLGLRVQVCTQHLKVVAKQRLFADLGLDGFAKNLNLVMVRISLSHVEHLLLQLDQARMA